MIFVDKTHSRKNTIERAYLYEAYIRLYAESVSFEGRIDNFDYFTRFLPRTPEGYPCYSFREFLCPDMKMRKIINDLLKEPYILKPGGKPHKLTSASKKSISIGIMFGSAPVSGKDSFLKTYPHLKRIEDHIPEDEYYNEEDGNT